LLNLKETIASLARNRAKWEALMRGAGLAHPSFADIPMRLGEVDAFGSNPGNLRMFTYVPPSLRENPALLVVLHGCRQSAASYDHGAGWSTLADRYGFVLLLPEQQRSNNPNGCFNWFRTGDTRRGRGEALSIRQMVERIMVDRKIDRRRIFVTGLSAGGAMTSAMLACYPDVFAGGAIIAGLPYGAAATVQQAFESMFQSPPRPAQEWGDHVRRASRHRGPWPRISVWHGSDDKTVIPDNAQEILKQWTNVHGLSLAPSSQATVDGYPREVWTNESGEELIESYTITDMAHGTPLATGSAHGKHGNAGPFLLEAGISSSYHIAKFFGLADERAPSSWWRHDAAARRAENVMSAAPDESQVLEGEILDSETDVRFDESHEPRLSPIDIGAVITRALKAAGLMKDR
jgi:feruloyl esterase